MRVYFELTYGSPFFQQALLIGWYDSLFGANSFELVSQTVITSGDFSGDFSFFFFASGDFTFFLTSFFSGESFLLGFENIEAITIFSIGLNLRSFFSLLHHRFPSFLVF